MNLTKDQRIIIVEDNQLFSDSLAKQLKAKLNLEAMPLILATLESLREHCEKNEIDTNCKFLVNFHFKPSDSSGYRSDNHGLKKVVWWLRQQGDESVDSIYWCHVILYSFFSRKYLVNHCSAEVLCLPVGHGYVQLPSDLCKWLDVIEPLKSVSRIYRYETKRCSNSVDLAAQILDHDMPGAILTYQQAKIHADEDREATKRILLKYCENVRRQVGILIPHELDVLENAIRGIDDLGFDQLRSNSKSLARLVLSKTPKEK